MRQFIVNWEEYAGPLMQALHREAADGINVNAARLRDELLTYPGVPSRWKVADPLSVVPPMLTMRLKKEDLSLAFFKTLTTLAMPRDITLQQLRIECFYPADTLTEENARRFAEALAGGGIRIVNDVVFNQVLFDLGQAEGLDRILSLIQAEGTSWVGPTVWRGAPAWASFCGWSTTPEDAERSAEAILR